MTAFGLIQSHFSDGIAVGLPAITGLTAGIAEIGATLGVSQFGAPPAGAIQWFLDGAPIGGATDATLAVPEADGSLLTVSIDGESSAAVTIRHPAPVAAGTLSDPVFTQGTGLQSVDASGDFTFAGTALYTLAAAPVGTSINGASGVVLIDTDVTGPLAATVVVVRCADAGDPMRFADSGFSLTVEAAADTTAPVLSAATAAASGTDSFTGTVSTDETGGTLHVLASQAASETAAAIRTGGAAQPVTAAGVQAVSGTGLLAGTGYQLHFLHDDDAGNASAVLSSAVFTTDDVPAAFVAAQWSVADLATGADARITVTGLPDDGGSAIQIIQYNIGSGWMPIGGNGVGDYDLIGLFTDGMATDVRIRAVNQYGAGPASDTKTVTTSAAATVPSAFTAGQWSVADLATGGDARVTVTGLPADGGSAITAIEVRIDGGAWTNLGGSGTGDYDLIGLFTDGIAADVALRAVNAIGNGPAGDTKSVTTSTASTLAVTETGDGEITVDGASGTITVTVTAPAVYATFDIGNGPGVFQADVADLAAGPVALAPPRISGGGAAAAGVTLGSEEALWLYDEAGGAPVITRQWQADDGGNGSFANLSGATGPGYTLTASESGDDVRLRETAAQSGLGTRSAGSAAIGVAAGSGGATDAALTDSFVDSGDGQVYTLSALDIGAADANRRVVVMFGAKANTSLDSVTIGGVTAAVLQAWDASSNPDVAVYEALVPTGATGDLVITFANTNPSGIFGAVLRYTTGTATAFAAVEGQTASLDLGATISGAGAFVAGIAASEGAVTGWTWSGLATEALDIEFRGSGTDNVGSVAWSAGVPAGALAVSATPDGTPNSGKSLGILLEIV